MLIVESNCHNPDVNMLFDQYTLVRIEYLIGCDRVHGKTKNLEQNQYFVRVCMLQMNYICRKNWESFLSGIYLMMTLMFYLPDDCSSF